MTTPALRTEEHALSRREREFWIAVRRALLAFVAAIEAYVGMEK